RAGVAAHHHVIIRAAHLPPGRIELRRRPLVDQAAEPRLPIARVEAEAPCAGIGEIFLESDLVIDLDTHPDAALRPSRSRRAGDPRPVPRAGRVAEPA